MIETFRTHNSICDGVKDTGKASIFNYKQLHLIFFEKKIACAETAEPRMRVSYTTLLQDKSDLQEWPLTRHHLLSECNRVEGACITQ